MISYARSKQLIFLLHHIAKHIAKGLKDNNTVNSGCKQGKWQQIVDKW